MGRGRPPKPGTAEEKAAARRERVRNNVRALRQRRKVEGSLLNTVAEWSEQRKKQSSSEDESSVTAVGSRGSSIVSMLDTRMLIKQRDTGRSKVGLFSTPDTRKLYVTAFIGNMRASFLPDSVYLPPTTKTTQNKPWESDQFLWTPCAFWVTSAFTKASSQETGLLKTAVLAIGMVMKSLEFRDQSLRVAALEMYRRCLQGIRKSLEPLIADKSRRPRDSIALYLSCHAAAMFELILNSDLSATMHHLRGVSQLICHLGDGRDKDGQSIAWLLLQDYRFAELGLCLKYRYTSFSSIKRRQFEKDTLGSSEMHSQNLLVQIADIADEITAVMVQLDLLRPMLRQPNTFTKIEECLSQLRGIWQGYETIHAKVIQFCGPSFLYNDNESTGLADGSVKFKTYDIGAAWCYNLMTQIYCLETSIDAVTLLLDVGGSTGSRASPADSEASGGSDVTCEVIPDGISGIERLQKLRKLHRSVCIKLTQCIQYFLQTDKGVIGQALAIYPLDAAINMLECELIRLQADLLTTTGRASASELDNLLDDIASIEEAKKFCKQLQARAKAFGLPAFHEAGDEYVSSLQEDQLTFGAKS